MKISQLRVEDINIDNKELINKVLFDGIEDDGENGDLIFVFGSMNATQYRVPKAIELYKSKRAEKILMSGGKLEKPEALSMMEKAVELGVPAEDIIVESKSSNTKENVLESKIILQNSIGLANINRILIVSTHYHMRRCYLTLKTYMPEHIRYSLCAANDLSTRKDNWWEFENGTKRVLKEGRGLIYYTREGKIMDFEL